MKTSMKGMEVEIHYKLSPVEKGTCPPDAT